MPKLGLVGSYSFHAIRDEAERNGLVFERIHPYIMDRVTYRYELYKNGVTGVYSTLSEARDDIPTFDQTTQELL